MRKTAMLTLALATLASIAAIGHAHAKGPHAAGTRNYDPSTVQTVSGEVTSVDRVPSPSGKGGGVHLTLKTERETIAVHLGPAWYIDEQKMRLKNGDHIEVEGSRVSVEGKPALIARQVKRDGESLTLRNAAGVPAWAGHGGGRP